MNSPKDTVNWNNQRHSQLENKNDLTQGMWEKFVCNLFEICCNTVSLWKINIKGMLIDYLLSTRFKVEQYHI